MLDVLRTLLALFASVVVAAADSGVEHTIETPPDAVDVAAIAPEIDESQAIWWTHVASTSSAVANFGPVIPTSTGGAVRRWVLIIHRPDAEQPLTCLQGMIPSTDRHPIWVESGDLRVHLSPLFDQSWGEVRSAGEIRAEVAGLD